LIDENIFKHNGAFIVESAIMMRPDKKARRNKTAKRTPMPQATFIGELFETPKQRHPQELPLAELYRVEGHTELDGIYVVPVRVSEDRCSRKFFLSYARKITSRLPVREGLVPTYGVEEFCFSPSAEPVVSSLGFPTLFPPTDLLNRSNLRETVESGIRKRYTKIVRAEFN
jgi:hypothetical protein